MGEKASTPSSTLLRMLGLLLILLGFLLVSIALIPGEGGEGIIIFFPFVFRVSGSLALLLSTLLFFVFMASMILLPWYLISRSELGGLGEVWTPLRRRSRETTEYIITLEVPRALRNTLYVEVEEGEIYLRSTRDPTFQRRYTLPVGFDVEDVEFDYEGSYLILKLLLRKPPSR
jgi:hypothetical protein